MLHVVPYELSHSALGVSRTFMCAGRIAFGRFRPQTGHFCFTLGCLVRQPRQVHCRATTHPHTHSPLRPCVSIQAAAIA
jgi:hypothetical protein